MRNLLIALGVLALLGVATFVTFRKSPDETATAAPEPWHHVDRAQVTKITMQAPGGGAPITLEKRGDAWFMSSPANGPADTAAINDILEPLAEMKVTSTAARETSSHATLEVDDAHAIHVTLFHDAATVLDLLVGKSLDNGTAVRLPGQPVAYRVDRGVRYAIAKEPREYRDRTITQLARDHVRSVEWYAAGGATYQFDRSGDTWTPAASNAPLARLDTAKVNTLVSNLLTLRATDFTAADAPNGIEPNGPHVTINLDNGPSVTLRVGSDTTSGVNARHDGVDIVYVIASSHKAEINLDPTLLQAPVPVDGGAHADAAAPAPSAPPIGMPGVVGAPGGAGGNAQIPPEVLQQLIQQARARGAAGGAPPRH